MGQIRDIRRAARHMAATVTTEDGQRLIDELAMAKRIVTGIIGPENLAAVDELNKLLDLTSRVTVLTVTGVALVEPETVGAAIDLDSFANIPTFDDPGELDAFQAWTEEELDRRIAETTERLDGED